MSPVDIYNMPEISNKQHFILWHSDPGDVWGWFTSCIAKQSQIRTFIHSLVITIYMTSSLVELKGKNTTMYDFGIDSLLQWKIIHTDFNLKGSVKQPQYIYNVLCNSHFI